MSLVCVAPGVLYRIAVLARGVAEGAPEVAGEVALVNEAGAAGNVDDPAALAQEGLRLANAGLHQVGVGGNTAVEEAESSPLDHANSESIMGVTGEVLGNIVSVQELNVAEFGQTP